jgi:hypothetical protein
MVVGTAMIRRWNRVGFDRRGIHLCRCQRRQQAERIHVSVGIVGRANAEIDVRLGRLTD